MPTPSPLASLVATLATICQQAQQHQQLLSKNEAATRAVLIDPVLRALGWDTADVMMVVPEFAVSNKQKPDYFLKNTTGATHIVIEAKKLGEDLDKMGHTGKLIGYAFTLKPLYHFVTDGLRWHCFSPNHSQYEPYERIALTSDGLLQAATQLLQLLDAAHGGYGLTSTAPAAQRATAEKLVAKPPKPTSSKVSRAYMPLTAALALDSPGKPTWLRLPNGSEHSVKTWKDILLAACTLVLHTRPDLSLPLPDKAGKKTALFRREQPAKRLSFTTVNYQGRPAYIYTNYSATDCLANALYILKLLPKEQQRTETAIAFGD